MAAVIIISYRFLIILIINIVLLFWSKQYDCCCCCYEDYDERQNVLNQKMSSISNNNNEKSIDLILNLTKSLHNSGTNLLLCPYSLLTTLSMLIAGSRGKTRNELLKVLYSETKLSNDEEIQKFLQKISKKHQEFIETYKNVWHQASMVYCRDDLKLDSSFAQSLTKMFQAQTKQLNFHSIKDSVRIINEDVYKETKGFVENIVNDLDPEIALLLIDAIHFKDIWDKQFDQNKSHLQSFRLSDGKTTVETWMMHQTAVFNYYEYESLNVRAIRLPYRSNQRLAMLIILPSDNGSVDDDGGDSAIKTLIKQMNQNHLKAILDGMLATAPQKIELSLPRFKISSTHQHLIEHFRQSGLCLLFDQCQADLSAMLTNDDDGKKQQQQQCSNVIENPRLYVSEIMQKAMIEVNEQGTEAIALTKISVRNKRSAEFIEEMICDRPFMFMIILSDPLNILFSGILENPLSS